MYPHDNKSEIVCLGSRTATSRNSSLWPRGAYQTKDVYIALNVADNIIWARICAAMGREDLVEDERANTGTARSANVAILQPILEGRLGTLSRDEAVETLNAQGVPCGPIYTAEDVFADLQVEARGMIMPIDDPEFGTFGFARTPLHLSSAPEQSANPAPNLGQHTRGARGPIGLRRGGSRPAGRRRRRRDRRELTQHPRDRGAPSCR